MEEKIIDIALFDAGLFFVFGNENFKEILDRYSWQTNNKKYEFRVKPVKDEDILNGNIRNFDVITFGATDEYGKLWIWKKLYPEKYLKWIRNISDFIREGGGYVGHCGGANLICELHNEPETSLEKSIKEVNFGIAGTKVYQKGSIPLLDQLAGLPPTAMEGEGYVVYDGFKPDAPQMGGVPLDFVVKDKNHPILKGYKGNTLRIFWGGGPGLVPSSKAKTLLSYPEKEISELHPMHVWEYVGTGKGGYLGKWIGLAKSIAWSVIDDRKVRRVASRSLLELTQERISAEEFVMRIYKHAKDEKEGNRFLEAIAEGIYKAKDWKLLNQVMPIKRAGMAALVTENYVDGRLVISGPHSEDDIWDDGRIIDVEDTDENCLWDGFMRWIDYGDKGKQNKWFLRREVAWAAGLNEDELPPIPEESPEKKAMTPKKPVKRRESLIEVLLRIFRRWFKK